MSHTVQTFKSFAWNHLSKLSEYGLTYIFGIFLARTLGADDYSIYVTLISLASFAMILGGLGFDETVNKFISQLSVHNQIGFIRYLVKKLTILRSLLLFVICLNLIFFKSNISSWLNNNTITDFLIILCFYIFFQSLVNLFANIFIAQIKTRTVFFINVSTKLSTLIIGIYILNSGYGLYEILILIASMSFLTFSIYLVAGGRNYILNKSEKYITNEPLKFGLATWGNMLLTFLMGKNSNVLILSFILGTTVQISYYEIAFSFTQLIEYIFSIGFMGVALSSFSSLAVTEPGKLKFLRLSVMKYLQIFVLPFSIYVFIYAEFVISTIFSQQYLPSVPLLRAFLAFNIFSVSFLGSGANTAVLFAIGKERIVFIIHLIFGILNVSLIILFVPISGILVAMIITGSCLLLTVLSEFIYTTSKIGFAYDFSFLLKIVAVSLIAGLISYISKEYIITNNYSASIVYFIIIILGYIVTKLPNKELKNLLSKTRLNQFLNKH